MSEQPLSRDDILTPDVDEQIRYCARRTCRQYRHMQLDDLVQEGRIWALQHPGRMRGFLYDENPKRGWARMTRTFDAVMGKVARVEKAHREGYDPDDEYFYTLAILELCLPALWDEHLRRHGPAREDETGTRTTGRRDPSEGNSWVALVADVQSAWDAVDLSGRDRAMLRARFENGASFADLGRAFQVATSTAQQTVRRSLRKLQRVLGGQRPVPCDNVCEDRGGPGSRHVVSNAQARAILDNQYEEG